jgi:hypothetical protein
MSLITVKQAYCCIKSFSLCQFCPYSWLIYRFFFCLGSNFVKIEIYAAVEGVSLLPLFAATVVDDGDDPAPPAVMAGVLPACRIFCRSSALGIATPP